MKTAQHAGALAELLAYPDERYFTYLADCRMALAENPESLQCLDRFAHEVEGMTIEGLQELYTQTFDLNPICSLEFGWQLFGENYSRGEFLVEMRQTLRRLDVPESTELPDHITHVMAAFSRMEAAEAGRFAGMCLLPALEKMLQGLSGKECPYTAALEAIRAVISVAAPTTSGGDRPRPFTIPLPVVDPSTEVCHG
jgi:nitrate reductase delta subunit